MAKRKKIDLGPAASKTVSAPIVPTEPADNLKPATQGTRNRKQAQTALVPSDPILAAYMREVHRYPILSRQEEHELAVKYHETQDRETLHRLVTANLRFVVKIAFEYVHYRLKLLDLIQEGNMGLVKAVREFNPYKDVRITTYAVWWIRSYIQDAILRNYSLVKIGTTQAQKRLFYRLKAEQNRLEKQGIVPEERLKLLASNLEVKEKEVQEMDQRLSSADLSLDTPLAPDEKVSHLQKLADPAVPIDESLGEQEQLVLFRRILGQFGEMLTGREKVIFNERLVSEKPITLQEIGDRYQISKERARQLEEQIKDRLREYVQNNYPDYEVLVPKVSE